MINQLLCHLWGDYLLQSSWMANNKTKNWVPAIVHAAVYILPFVLIFHLSLPALAVMSGTHAFLDRYRPVKYVIFSCQFLAPPAAWPRWDDHKTIGYHKDTPVWLATWLMIIVDNTIHLTINALALAYL